MAPAGFQQVRLKARWPGRGRDLEVVVLLAGDATTMGICDPARGWEEVVRWTVVRLATFIAGGNVGGGDGVTGIPEGLPDPQDRLLSPKWGLWRADSSVGSQEWAWKCGDNVGLSLHPLDVQSNRSVSGRCA